MDLIHKYRPTANTEVQARTKTVTMAASTVGETQMAEGFVVGRNSSKRNQVNKEDV